MMHRASAPMMTVEQAAALCVSYGATFKKKDARTGIDWWELPDKTWLGVRKVSATHAEVRRVSAEACGCQ